MLSFSQLKKNLKQDFSAFRQVKLALLADTSSQLLNHALKGYGYEVQLAYDIYESDYNQIDLQIFDPNSKLYQFAPDFVFVNKSSEQLLSDYYHSESQRQKEFAESIMNRIVGQYDALGKGLTSRIIINTFPEINDSVFGNFAAKTNSFIYQCRKLNVLIMEFARSHNDVFVCDIGSLASNIGRQQAHDPKMYYSHEMAYTLDFQALVAKNVTDIVQASLGVFKKCLILDLDNTLWGGIIGDDGMEGIEIGNLGIGKSFSQFQLWAKQLKRRGILLAACSKNTEAIAKEPFQLHGDMVLRMEDFAVFVANWKTKVENILYIQKVLNIGSDSIVFVDDNKFEREMVRAAIPGITIPEMPEDPTEYVSYLQSLNLFETASVTEEDEIRTSQYQQEFLRNEVQGKFNTEADFLASLEMKGEVKPFLPLTAPRVAQLSQRSNQFNVRTIRYGEGDILSMAKTSDYCTFTFGLRDRFGDYGLIGIVILKDQGNGAFFIENWIMSCRVLNRGMENFTLNAVVSTARSKGGRRLIGEYIPTKKNGIVKDLYKNMGFILTSEGWVLDLMSYVERETLITA
jgi:FkbH-like protein